MNPAPALRPVPALFGIAAGALVALTAMPEFGAYWEAGALTLSSLALAFGLLLGPTLAALHNPQSALRLEHLLMFGLVFWILLDPIQGAYPLDRVGFAALQQAFLGIAVFAAALWLGSAAAIRMFPRRPIRSSVDDLSVEFLFWAGLLCFVLGNLRILIGCRLELSCIADSFFVPRFRAPWARRGDFGNFDTILMHMRYFGYLLLPIAIGLHHLQRRLTWRVAVIGGLGLLTLTFVIGNGYRSHVGVIFGATLITWALLQDRFNWRAMLKIIVPIVIALLAMQAMRAWRTVGFEAAIAEGRSLEIEGQSGFAVDNNLQYLGYAIEVVPQLQPHTGWRGAACAILTPVPRLPKDLCTRQIDLPIYYGLNMGRTFNWTGSAIADLHVIGGWPVILVGGFLFGVAANFVTRLLQGPRTIRNTLIYALSAMALFVGLRALVQVFVLSLMVFAAIGLLTLRRMLLKRVQQPLISTGLKNTDSNVARRLV